MGTILPYSIPKKLETILVALLRIAPYNEE
jgi:hypothetical protein